MMDEKEMLHRIGMLVNERRELLRNPEWGDAEDDRHARIKAINAELERMWDMVRRDRVQRANRIRSDVTKAA
jgi:hypothetical protein